MKRYFSTVALAIGLLGGVIAPGLKASETDRLTKITIDQPIEIQNTPLTAGTYVIKLADTVDHSIVQIFNADDNRLVATILAVHALQLEPTGESRFDFYKGAGEQPPALHFWFYPGRTDGLEFWHRRPRVEARSAPANKTIAASIPRIHADVQN
jgi:hypothetical protein